MSIGLERLKNRSHLRDIFCIRDRLQQVSYLLHVHSLSYLA
ncbi:MAG: hypothetical protein WB014_03175 [Methanosarcina sp.]